MAIDTPEPSPFSHEILNANPYAFLDDAPLEERRTRAVQLRRTLRAGFAEGAGALDPAAIAQVAAEAWPPMRDADELHDALLTLACCRSSPREGFAALATIPLGRPANGARLAADAHRATGRELLGCARRSRAEPLGSDPTPRRDSARLVRIGGPLRASDLAQKLALPRGHVDMALAQLEGEGQILRGQFTGGRAGSNGATGACWRVSTG